MQSTEANQIKDVMFYCSTTVAGNQLVGNSECPDIASDFEKTFTKLRQLPCDVFLAPHGSFFGRDEKIESLDAGRKDAFVNSENLKDYVDRSQKSFREALIRQREKQR